MLLDIVNIFAAAKKQKKLELSVGIVMHDGMKGGKKRPKYKATATVL